MMLHQRLAITAATPNLIPMPAAHAPLGRSTRQIAVRPLFLHLENRRSHSSNPHRSQRRNRAPSGPRFRALALLGRLSWERVDGFVMQASEKPAQNRNLITGPQNLVGLRDVGVCELGQAEVRLHALTSYPQNADRSCRISAGAGPQTSYLL